MFKKSMDYKSVYDASFSVENYAKHNNNEYRYGLVNNYIKNNTVNSVIDVSSGRGNVIDLVQKHNPKIEILSTDLTKYHNFNVPFIQLNLCDQKSLSQLMELKFDVLSCLDVMEHLEKSCVDNVLKMFSKISKISLITIANHPDNGGIPGGPELHLIQENMSYWGPLLEKHFTIVNLREEYNGRLYLLELKSKNYE